MNKKYLLYAILPVMALGIFSAVYAVSAKAGIDNPMSGLVTAIAEKFNLNVSDVQAVFDEQKTQMEAQREEQKAEMETKSEQNFIDRLSQAVADGKLTQEQADKIIAKKAELEVQKTSSEDITEEERRAAMEEQKDSLKQWATDNGIPEEYFRFIGFGMGRDGGPGGHQGGGPGMGFGHSQEAGSPEASSSE